MYMWAVLGGWLAAAPAAADFGLVHLVQQGDTLASIAERYYGEPQRESILVLENGLNREGGSEIVVGMRLTIPAVIFYRVQEGETWAELAKKFYGDARRAFLLFEVNGQKTGTRPDPGHELLVPYPLRYVVGQNETLRQIAKLFYNGNVNEGVNQIMRFNSLRRQHVERGDIVLVPIANLVLSEQGRKLAEQEVKDLREWGSARQTTPSRRRA